MFLNVIGIIILLFSFFRRPDTSYLASLAFIQEFSDASSEKHMNIDEKNKIIPEYIKYINLLKKRKTNKDHKKEAKL